MPANALLLSIQAAFLAQATPDPDPQSAQDIFCDTQGSALSLAPDQGLAVRCPEGCELTLPVWGTMQYTDDSSVCVAAIHAGQMTPQGGILSVYRSHQSAAFVGSNSNGVSSQDSGTWPASFQFEAQQEAAPPQDVQCNTSPSNLGAAATRPGAVLSIVCPASCENHAVWGTDMYTSDSSICVAAIHAGALPPEGGLTTFFAAPGQTRYVGSEQNGVSTRPWGPYPGSFLFANALNPTDAQALTCKDNAQGLDDENNDTFKIHCPKGCTEGPEIWGFEVYSDDSSVCRAAIHADALSPRGGVVTVRINYGVESLEAKEQNGILSRGWGPWYRTFSFAEDSAPPQEL